jgi:hypothetical protein
MSERERSDEFWELAIAVNAMAKGLLGSMGESGHVCQRAIPLARRLEPEAGMDVLLDAFADLAGSSGELQAGDVLVVPDKLLSIAQGRIGPRELLVDPDPKTVDADRRAELAERWSAECGFPITPFELLLADEYRTPGGDARCTVGARDHNGCAHALAGRVRERAGLTVDVVVSDTDTGLDVREPLIGTLTIGATPLGATAGLTLYEAMRCACAAEFTRGHARGVPVVVCRPAARCSRRPGCGEFRGYHGALHARHEPGLTYA